MTDRINELIEKIAAAKVRAAPSSDKAKELERGLRVTEHLPEKDWADVTRRVRIAVSRNWTSIGLWTGDGPADPSDLFGVSPETGFGDFIPYYKEEPGEHQEGHSSPL